MNIKKNKRILIVEVNWLGDVLFSTAAIRKLRQMYPDSFIACLVHGRCELILKGNPHINELIILDEPGNHRGFWGKIALMRQLRLKRFDTVYLFHRSFTRTALCLLSGIAHRIGYITPKRRALLTQALRVPNEPLHRAAYYMYIITQHVVCDKKQLRSDFFVSKDDELFINNLLIQHGCDHNAFVVIHPAGNWQQKRWPKKRVIEFAEELIRRYQCNVIFTGTEKERPLINEIVRNIKVQVIDLCGLLSLKQFGALLKRADVFVSGDSGPLHIAVALGTRVVALYGPTAQSITGPLTTENVSVLQKEIDCRIPCYELTCPDNRCMAAIEVADVLSCIHKNQWLKTKQ